MVTFGRASPHDYLANMIIFRIPYRGSRDEVVDVSNIL